MVQINEKTYDEGVATQFDWSITSMSSNAENLQIGVTLFNDEGLPLKILNVSLTDIAVNGTISLQNITSQVATKLNVTIKE